MHIGERIRTLRQEKNLLQRELAEKVGISESALRNYELVNRNPSEDKIQKIAEALGVSHNALTVNDFSDNNAIMHTLFVLESKHGLNISKYDDIPYMFFDDTNSPDLLQKLRQWQIVHNKYMSGEITSQEYSDWKLSFNED